MGNLTRNFDREEYACSCGCEPIAVDYELALVVQDVREFIDAPLRITSAYRCSKYNKKVGGAKNSKHLLGIAADIQSDHVKPHVIQSYLKNKYPDKYGIGEYETFTHIDVRPNKARWKG